MTSIFRYKDWGDSHLSFILGFAIIFSFLSETPFSFFIQDFVFIFILGVFMASLGYYINDLCDVESDKIVQKYNFAQNHSFIQKTILIGLLLFGILTCWFAFSKSMLILILLCIEIALFISYSSKFFRLKENSFLGPILDSLYAYTIPLITISLITYHDKLDLFYLIILIVWVFIYGTREIFLHYINDYSNDLKSNTQTFATKEGLTKIKSKRKLLIFVEVVSFSIFLILTKSQFLILIFSSYFIYILLKEKYYNKKINYESLGYELQDFYISWLPLVILVIFTLSDLRYLIVIAAFLFLNIRHVRKISKHVLFIKKLFFSLFYNIFIPFFKILKTFLSTRINLILDKIKNRFKNYE